MLHDQIWTGPATRSSDIFTRHLLPVVLIIGGSALFAEALGDRPHEDEEAASWIVTGETSKVFTRDGGPSSAFFHHVIQIRIEDVEKGEGYRKGDTIYAYVLRRKPGSSTGEPGISGHHGVPEEGQRIRAWIKHSRGQMEGLYPRWFEVLEPAREAQDQR